MALTSGTRLGPYEVVGSLGAGGMGEVYRARDSRLDRDVAIKVVRADRAASEGSRERFEREARAVAALSHPNILDIHDVGTADGRIYAVMELLDGETLRARLERGPLSWRKAVEIGAAIADGLGAAHAKGIVHRDLKPANVFLMADGRVKVLDFGLATLCEPAGADPLSAATLSQPDPPGALGTVGYMSPEQVAGTATTARSDLFALGCVLQEMVTGQRTFARRTPAETMAAILNEDPAEIVVDAPLGLRRSIARCLEKDPDARFQSARDLAFHLRALLDPAASGRAPAPSADGSTKRRRAVWLAGSAAVAIALVLLSLSWRTAPEAAPSAVQSYLLPPDGTVVIAAAGVPVRAGPIAVSPDGQQLAFARQPARREALAVGPAVQLPGRAETRRHAGRRRAVLVAGQPFDRLQRRRPAQVDRRLRGPASDTGRNEDAELLVRRWRLEPDGRHRVRPVLPGPPPPAAIRWRSGPGH